MGRLFLYPDYKAEQGRNVGRKEECQWMEVSRERMSGKVSGDEAGHGDDGNHKEAGQQGVFQKSAQRCLGLV